MENIANRLSVERSKIDEKTKFNLLNVDHSKELISRRLKNLESEWDIERYLETNAALFTIVGLVLTFTVSIFWLLFTILIQIFLLQHAFQGWCPPLIIFRRMCKRTKREIENERHALKVLRGDFKTLIDPITILKETSRFEP